MGRLWKQEQLRLAQERLREPARAKGRPLAPEMDMMMVLVQVPGRSWPLAQERERKLAPELPRVLVSLLLLAPERSWLLAQER